MRTAHVRLVAALGLMLALVVSASPTLATPGDLSEDTIDQGYTKIYLNVDTAFTTPSQPVFMGIITIYDMVDEESAMQMVDGFVSGFEDDDEVSDLEVNEIEDLADDARTLSFTLEDGQPQSATVAREGDVVIMAITLGADTDQDLSLEMVTFVLESGPSDVAPEKDAEGIITGGWADAFPMGDDIPALEGADDFEVWDPLDESPEDLDMDGAKSLTDYQVHGSVHQVT